MSRTVLAWIDLETTGLNKESGRILEYAVVFTDLELNELGAREAILLQDRNIAVELMDDYVVKMHTQNGLLDKLIVGDTTDYEDSLRIASSDILADMSGLELELGNDIIFVIGGSTIGFDKGWIEKHMPGLFEKLHYRQLDVSGYKVGFPELFGTATSNAHRAMDDIQASIATHRRMQMIVNAGVKALAEQGVILGV